MNTTTRKAIFLEHLSSTTQGSCFGMQMPAIVANNRINLLQKVLNEFPHLYFRFASGFLSQNSPPLLLTEPVASMLQCLPYRLGAFAPTLLLRSDAGL